MIRYVLLAIIVLPLTEIALFVMLGGEIGLLGTLLTVVGTALLGFYLLTQHSLGSLLRSPQQWAEMLSEGEAALIAVLGTGLLAVAGILLLIPGFFTDALGGLLLLPPMRALVAARLLARLAGVWRAARAKPSSPSNVIEGEYKADPPSNEPPN